VASISSRLPGGVGPGSFLVAKGKEAEVTQPASAAVERTGGEGREKEISTPSPAKKKEKGKERESPPIREKRIGFLQKKGGGRKRGFIAKKKGKGAGVPW